MGDGLQILRDWCRVHADAGRRLGGPGHAYSCAEDFLLRHGVVCRPAPLPPGVRMGRPRRCFDNSLALARRRRLVYYEGLAWCGFIPVYHAWCCRPGDDAVIDPTWRKPGSAYLGVAFGLDYVARCLKEDGCAVLQNYQDGYALFRGDVPPEVWEGRSCSQPTGSGS